MKYLLSLSLAVFITATAYAQPAEIIKQLRENGTVLAVHKLQYDSDLKYIIYAQHGQLYIIAYARWENTYWRFTNEDLLEVYISINKKPHLLWTKSP